MPEAEMYVSPEDRIAKLERKVQVLEAWCEKVAPLIKQRQQQQAPAEAKKGDPVAGIYEQLFGKRS